MQIRRSIFFIVFQNFHYHIWIIWEKGWPSSWTKCFTAHNWQNWSRAIFLSSQCHEINRVEVSLKNSNNAFKNYDFGQHVKFGVISLKINNSSITAKSCNWNKKSHMLLITVIIYFTVTLVFTYKSIYNKIHIFHPNFVFLA